MANTQSKANEGINDIYGMLNKQEETIASLLNKYRDEEPIEFNLQ